jgi:hypothetical protein
MVQGFTNDGGRLLMSADVRGQPAIWVSSQDGATWTVLAGVPADAGDVGSGPFGLVATGEHPSEWWDRSQSAPTVIEQDGFTLSIDEGSEGCTVRGPDRETVLTADCFSAGQGPEGLELPPFISADHDVGVFTVVDPDSGDRLMTISYREMQDAFERAQVPAGYGPDTFVVYSADGRTWSEQSISELTGEAGWITSVAVSDDFAEIVVNEMDGPASLWRATMD